MSSPPRQARSIQRARASRAFTIIEAIVVVVILGILVAVVAPRLINRIGESKRAVAKNGAATIRTAMLLFQADNGALPQGGDSVMVLWERPSYVSESTWKRGVESAEDLKDPWGNLYVLRIPGQNGADFDIISYGADGQEGGEGENEDIISGKR